MAIGYMGKITLDGTEVHGEGGSMAMNPPRLEAGGAFGSKGLHRPRVYDWTKYEGSIEFELTEKAWTKLKSIILNRRTSFSVNIRAMNGTESDFPVAWWTSISINASEGSLVTASISIVALDGTITASRNPYQTYIEQRTYDVLCSNGHYNELIAFWETRLEQAGTTKEIMTWSLSINQDLVFEQLCQNQGVPVAPSVRWGIATAELTFNEVGGSQPLMDIEEIKIFIREDAYILGTLELNTLNNDVAGQDGIVQGNVSYNIYEMEINN